MPSRARRKGITDTRIENTLSRRTHSRANTVSISVKELCALCEAMRSPRSFFFAEKSGGWLKKSEKSVQSVADFFCSFCAFPALDECCFGSSVGGCGQVVLRGLCDLCGKKFISRPSSVVRVKSCLKVVTFIYHIPFLSIKLCRVSAANEAELKPPISHGPHEPPWAP